MFVIHHLSPIVPAAKRWLPRVPSLERKMTQLPESSGAGLFVPVYTLSVIPGCSVAGACTVWRTVLPCGAQGRWWGRPPRPPRSRTRGGCRQRLRPPAAARCARARSPVIPPCTLKASPRPFCSTLRSAASPRPPSRVGVGSSARRASCPGGPPPGGPPAGGHAHPSSGGDHPRSAFGLRGNAQVRLALSSVHCC